MFLHVCLTFNRCNELAANCPEITYWPLTVVHLEASVRTLGDEVIAVYELLTTVFAIKVQPR